MNILAPAEGGGVVDINDTSLILRHLHALSAHSHHHFLLTSTVAHVSPENFWLPLQLEMWKKKKWNKKPASKSFITVYCAPTRSAGVGLWRRRDRGWSRLEVTKLMAASSNRCHLQPDPRVNQTKLHATHILYVRVAVCDRRMGALFVPQSGHLIYVTSNCSGCNFHLNLGGKYLRRSSSLS